MIKYNKIMEQVGFNQCQINNSRKFIKNCIIKSHKN